MSASLLASSGCNSPGPVIPLFDLASPFSTDAAGGPALDMTVPEPPDLAGSCSDGVRDGDETDLDCGGRCAACVDGRACLVALDCRSGMCLNNTCTTILVAACNDGIKNGSESDVDCGGMVCPTCGLGRACAGNADCASRTCTNGKCISSRPLTLLFSQPIAVFSVGNAFCGGDLNGDNINDVVFTTTAQPPKLDASLGQRGINFAAPSEYALPNGASSSAICADVDKDGRTDVLLGGGANAFSFYRGAGDGTLKPAAGTTVGMQGGSLLALGDVDLDGKLDAVTEEMVNNRASFAFLKGNGDGTFAAPLPSPALGIVFPNDLRIGDFNGDKQLDAIASDGTSSLVLSLFGNGGFGQATFTNAPNASRLAIGDLDRNGKLDAVTCGSISQQFPVNLNVYPGQGNGSFGNASTTLVQGGANCAGLEIVDMNLDGLLDVVVATRWIQNGLDRGQVYVFPGAGNGALQQPVSFDLGVPGRFVVADINSDGKPDLVVLTFGAAYYYLNLAQ